MDAGGLLSISGNWINNGTVSAGAGTVKFNGTGTQSITSTVNPTEITSYLLSTFTKGMTELTGAAAGPVDDDGNLDIPIGFTFNFAGTVYSTLRLSTNGWASLNLTGSLGYTNTDLFTSTAPNASLTAWWDDLSDDGTSVVSYKTEGAAPNRIFTAEWKRVLTYYSSATARISFQLKLYESTNVIEFHYGNVESGTHNAAESASIGIEDATGGSGHFMEATTGSTTTGVTNLVSTSNWPTVNYRYTPAELSLEFNNLVFENTGGTVNLLINTNITGNFDVLPGASFAVKTGKTLIVQGTVVE
jgi:hypothetical protein